MKIECVGKARLLKSRLLKVSVKTFRIPSILLISLDLLIKCDHDSPQVDCNSS